MVILELEDHALSSAGEHVLGRIKLPAGVRGRVDEQAVCRARLLPRLDTGHASSRKIRASEATDGAFIPRETIL